MATLLSDAFTGSNGTSLSGRAMSGTPGKSWSVLAGTWTLNGSNQAVYGGSGAPYMVIVSDANAADVVITCDLAVPSATNYLIAIAFRAVDKDNTWFAIIERAGGGTADLKVFDRSSGTDNAGNVSSFSGSVSGTTQTLTITLSGNTINVSCTDPGHADNAVATTTSATRNSATKHGLFAYTDGTYVAGAYDNFLVTGTALGGGGSALAAAAQFYYQAGA